MAIYMRYWDCKYCGTTHIGGNKTTCPNCGKERGADTVFYDGDTIEFLDESESAKVRVMGEDWECPYCDGMNRGNETHCNNCGAKRPPNARVYNYRNKNLDKNNVNQYSIDDILKEDSNQDDSEDIFGDSEKDTDESDDLFNSNQNIDEVINAKTSMFSNQNNETSRFNSSSLKDILKPLSIISFCILFIGLFVWFLMPKWTTAEVVDKFWEKTVSIESYETLQKNGWDETVPSDARVHSTDYRYRRTDQVYSHSTYEQETYQEYEQIGTRTEYRTVDLGNGYADRQSYQVPEYGYVTKTRTVEKKHYKDVPVFDTWVEYEVDRWVHNRNEVSGGNYKEEEVWPVFTLAELERESGRKEEYEVVLITKKDKKKNTTSTYTIDKELYNNLTPGESYELKIGLTSVVEIKGIETIETKVGSFN